MRTTLLWSCTFRVTNKKGFNFTEESVIAAIESLISQSANIVRSENQSEDDQVADMISNARVNGIVKATSDIINSAQKFGVELLKSPDFFNETINLIIINETHQEISIKNHHIETGAIKTLSPSMKGQHIIPKFPDAKAAVASTSIGLVTGVTTAAEGPQIGLDIQSEDGGVNFGLGVQAPINGSNQYLIVNTGDVRGKSAGLNVKHKGVTENRNYSAGSSKQYNVRMKQSSHSGQHPSFICHISEA